ncbi:hypothetical protein DNTS_011925 [Danionella cerebrum]|uniref:Homeobox domain-containing protein n=1 Tax=Danionella cerebrum TaxID=2873325 RepID=A0A553Q7K0_9TELE|nr:hypothetical protein DNTS_011925 [Danionella translucida]
MALPQLGYKYLRPVCSAELRAPSSLPGGYGTPFSGAPGFSAFLPYSSDLALLNQLGSQYEFKDSPGLHPAGFPHASFYPYGHQYPFGDPSRPKNATRESTSTLKAWLSEHRKNPYPTKGEKIMLAIITKMSLTQVSTWFANARRRLKKENKMTWVPKTRTDEEGNEYTSDTDDGDKRDEDEEIDLENIDTESVDDKPDCEEKSTSKVSDCEEYDAPGEHKRFTGEQKSPGAQEPLNTESPAQKPKIWSLAETAAAPDSPKKTWRNGETRNPLHAQNWTKISFSVHPMALSSSYLGLKQQSFTEHCRTHSL